MYNFQTFGCSNDESSPNSSCYFWNNNVRVSQISASLFSAMRDISSIFFLAQTSYTLDKNSPLEWNFRTFEWLGEKSPNSSCHIWNHKSVSLLNFALLFNAMEDKPFLATKEAHHSAKFKTSNCSGWISSNLYFDRLLFWKCIKYGGVMSNDTKES